MASGRRGLLFEDWRIGVVKHECPLSGVTVTHGLPQAHWYREPGGTLCVNLESMWDDFEQAVASFVRLLERDEPRRVEAINRWRKRAWTVRRLVVQPEHRIYEFGWHAAPAITGNPMPSAISKPEHRDLR